MTEDVDAEPDPTALDPATLDPATLAVRDLIAASRELVGRMAQVMGMNPNDMAAIGVLTQHGPMGTAEIARHLGIRSASATALVDRLELAGHAERVRDTVDRRRVVVTETSTARDASFAAWLPIVRDIDRVCRGLCEDEQTVVLAFLARITAATDRGGRAGSASGT